MKQIEIYNDQQANDKIYHVRQGARKIEALINFVKERTGYELSLKDIEQVKQNIDPAEALLDFTVQSKKIQFKAIKDSKPDPRKEREQLYKELKALLNSVRISNDSYYWYSVEGSRVLIREGYTKEIKDSYKIVLSEQLSKLWHESKALADQLNSFKMFLSYNTRPEFVSLIWNGKAYELNETFFLHQK